MLDCGMKKWSPLAGGFFKVNFDEATFKRQQSCGVGVLICDQRGEPIVALSEQIPTWTEADCIEAIATVKVAVYEELGKYGDLENQVLYRERVEELEPSIRYCLHKLGESNLQTFELMHIGEMEGPALDLFKAKLEAVMAEARSQQAASMTEFHWLGHKFPISNAKTHVSILKENEMEALQKDRAAELELNFDRTRVNGAVAKLIKVKDGFTMTALEVGCCRRKLFNIIVDTENTGKQLLQNGDLRRRVIILHFQVGKGNAEVALSLVGYDQELKGGGDLLRQLHALAEVESKLSIHQKRLSEIEAESAGGGRNVSAHKENGVSNSMERDLLPFQSMGPHMFLMAVPVMNVAPNHLHVLLVIFIKIIQLLMPNLQTCSVKQSPYFTSTFVAGVGVKREKVKLGSHLWACPTLYVSGVYSSTSDPVVVAPLNSQIPSVGAIKCEINSQRIAAESGAFNPFGKRSSKLKESQILEKNQPLEPSKDISEVAVCFLWNAGV
ncbi:unnamed protein product [Camellia sinensis]